MKLKIPRENANDDFITITKLHVLNGALVEKGELLLEFETSKTSVEFEAPIAGYVSLINISEGSQIKVDTVFAELLDNPKSSAPQKPQQDQIPDIDTKKLSDVKFTSEAAAELLAAGKVQNTQSTWITSKDFDAPTATISQSTADLREVELHNSITPQVKHTKKQITSRKSHEINALSVSSSYLNSTLGIEIELSTRRAASDMFSGSILDLVIYETTNLLKGQFSDLNACFLGGQSIAAFDEVIPGFALDDQNNLTVVAVPAFDNLYELSKKMTDLIIKFDERKLAPHDIKPTTFTVTDLSGAGINFILPLINGSQAFILGICGSLKGYQIFGTFDHRVTEGKRFAVFLTELKIRIETFAIENFPKISCHYCLKSLEEEKSLRNRGFLKIDDGDGEKLICRNCFEGW